MLGLGQITDKVSLKSLKVSVVRFGVVWVWFFFGGGGRGGGVGKERLSCNENLS